jgi:hypothetical protein
MNILTNRASSGGSLRGRGSLRKRGSKTIEIPPKVETKLIEAEKAETGKVGYGHFSHETGS